MHKKILHKLIRITTIPLSLEKLLEGQLTFMNSHYEVIAIAAEKERLEKYGEDNSVKTFWVEMTRKITPIEDLKAVFKLYRYFRIERPLIVHTHTPKAGIVGMLAGKLAGVPNRLHTVAGLPLLETSGFKRIVLNFVEKLTYSLATRVYPNSFELKKIILNLGYARESKLKVLGNGSSNGIDTSYFNPKSYGKKEKQALREELNIPLNDLLFIFVGRLVKEKGINELVRAFQNLEKENPQVSLLLVGPFEEDLDPLDPQVFEIIRKHSKIFVTGYQPDVRPYFSVADVLVFPSYREGFPNVVLQALAMELPAIVTNINGCNEIVEQCKNGLLIPVKDDQALYQAMLELMKNTELRKNLALNARPFIQQNFERRGFWEILLKEYKELELSIKHT